jgi:hypothetical protein
MECGQNTRKFTRKTRLTALVIQANFEIKPFNMKKAPLLVSFLLSFVTTFSQLSAFQRIAIPATTFELSATNAAQIVASFCSDFNRAAPEIKAKNFDFVHLDEKCVTIGNNPPISLQAALDNKFIDLEVNGYSSVKFKNLKKTSEPIKISIKKDIVVGDVKNDTKGIVLDDQIRHTNDPLKQSQMQQAFWERQSQIKSLTELNYLKEEDINNTSAFKEAVQRFQSNNNLTPDGIIGPNTNENLYANATIKKFLPKKFNRLSTIDAIKQFQKTYSLEETGLFEINTKIELTRLESISNKINNHEPLFNFYKNKFEGEALQYVSQLLSERTIFVENRQFTYVIAPDKEGYKFLKVQKNESNNGLLVSEGRSLTKSDILLFDQAYQNEVSKLSSSEVEVFHFGALDNNAIKFQLGKTSEIISISNNASYLENEVFTQIINKIKQQSKSKTIVIARDNFIRDIENINSVSLFATNDFKSFKSERINPQHIIEKLRAEFPNKTFYMGGDIEKDISSINSMPKVNSTSDVTAFTAPKSLEVNYDLLSKENVRRTFQQKNINVIDLDNPAISRDDVGSNIILITGNKDKNFEKYLGKVLQRVDVKDKVVVTFSCFKEGNDFTNSFIIKNFKANSIIYFPTKIHPDATKKVLLKFSEMVGNSSGSQTIRKLMEQSIEEVYKNETNEFLRTEINKLRQFIQQTSFNYNIKIENSNI